jgi:hypothetical protein
MSTDTTHHQRAHRGASQENSMTDVRTFHDVDGYPVEIDRRKVLDAYIENLSDRSTIQLLVKSPVSGIDGEDRHSVGLSIINLNDIRDWLGRGPLKVYSLLNELRFGAESTITFRLTHSRRLTEDEFKNLAFNVAEHILNEGDADEGSWGFRNITQVATDASHHVDGKRVHGPVTHKLSRVEPAESAA